MMAANRHRLKHRAGQGHAGARLALELLGRTDRLLGVILLGNNLINAAAATLTAVIVARLFGQGELALALGTLAVTFAILVFSEITPKVIGAAHADRLAPVVSYVLNPLLKPPVTWVVAFVNVFVQALLRLLRIRPAAAGDGALTQEEIRSLVLEGHYFRGKHRAMLANLFDLEHTTVDDVMTPRHQIHAARRRGQARAAARAARDELPHAPAGVRGLARQRARHPAHQAGRRAAAIRRRRRRAAARAGAPAVLRPGRHAAAHPALPVPAGPPAARPRGRRVRRAQGAGDHRGHHRGDHRRVHDHRAGRGRRPRSGSATPTGASWWTASRRCGC